jgi:hypothetical protein
MLYELQKVLVIESYKVIDLNQFVKMCRYTDQTLKNVDNKSKREEFFSDAARDEEMIVIVNSNQDNQNNDRSTSRSRFATSNLNSNRILERSLNHHWLKIRWIASIATIAKNSIIIHVIVVNLKINLNNFVRKIDVHEKNDSSIENFEIESKKE